MVGSFSCEVGHSSIVVEVCSDANHVFSKALRFVLCCWVKGLIGTFLEVMQHCVSGCFADSCVKESSVRGVDGQS